MDIDKLAAKIAAIPEHVVIRFAELAHDIRRKGFERYSARAILHQIRWHEHIERGNREFKCNDHWTPPLARWTMLKHPALNGMFETRKSDADGPGDEP